VIELILAALMVYGGVATYYSEEQFGGGPLYCDQFTPGETLIYSEDTEDWAAFDVGWYGDIVECGDKVRLFFPGGTVLDVLAWDAGRFGKYWVEDWGPDRKIIVDLPEHLRPDGAMSWPVVLINLTKLGLDATNP
jgi:hypothetical protein